jgi:hypothetical protein
MVASLVRKIPRMLPAWSVTPTCILVGTPIGSLSADRVVFSRRTELVMSLETSSAVSLTGSDTGLSIMGARSSPSTPATVTIGKEVVGVGCMGKEGSVAPGKLAKGIIPIGAGCSPPVYCNRIPLRNSLSAVIATGAP